MTASRLSPEALNALVDSGDLAGLVAPAVWMPVIAGMGGNAGTQVLAVTVRRLALGRISRRRAWAVIGKEVLGRGHRRGAGTRGRVVDAMLDLLSCHDSI